MLASRLYNLGVPMNSLKYTEEQRNLRDSIIEVLCQHTREMEGYSYFQSNPGVSQDDYEEIAYEILDMLG